MVTPLQTLFGKVGANTFGPSPPRGNTRQTRTKSFSKPPPLPRGMPPPRPGQSYHVFESTFVGLMGSNEHQAYLRMLDARKAGVNGFTPFPAFPASGGGARK